MRILVAEDDETNLKLMEMLLRPYGDVDTATDGKSALEAFSKAFNGQSPYRLVCLDIVMPEMDGHEVLGRIREMEEERGIHGLEGVRVIMTTALSDSRNILAAFRSQCEAYVIKPVNKKTLMKELRNLGLIEDIPR